MLKKVVAKFEKRTRIEIKKQKKLEIIIKKT